MKIILALLGLSIGWHAVGAENTSIAARDRKVQQLIDRVAAETLTRFATNKLASNQLAITLVNLRGNERPSVGSFRGDAPIYPASVVKLFYLASAHSWMEDGKLKDTAELRRALKDMIVESSNDATHYVLDAVTDTTSGPELAETEMKLWGEKRNAVNRYFTSLGYERINANQKPWCEGPYGRDRIWVGDGFTNRNALTTDATARLLVEIATAKCVSAARSGEMMALLARDRGNKRDGQGQNYTALGLAADAKLWSKAGWTSTARHDAVYVELADGRRFVLVTFTTGHANNREIIAFVARQVSAAL